MLDSMGNNIGYVFLGFAVAALFWVAFFMPETKGEFDHDIANVRLVRCTCSASLESGGVLLVAIVDARP